MGHKMLDLYTDYLITSTQYTTATGLARIFGNEFSHDKVTRFLSKEELDNKKLWNFIKPFVRSVEQEDSVLIVVRNAKDLLPVRVIRCLKRKVKVIIQLKLRLHEEFPY